MNKHCVYYCEGEDDQKLIDALKSDPGKIMSGKSEKKEKESENPKTGAPIKEEQKVKEKQASAPKTGDPVSAGVYGTAGLASLASAILARRKRK